MKQYAKRYDQIKAYTKENTGPGMTRKFGFETLTDEYRTAISQLAEREECTIVDLSNAESPYYCCGPSEFVYLIKNAVYVCTDSFHASVFSILYNRPFVVFNRNGKHNTMGKNYVAQILGDRYIIPTYGVWERFEDIDFSTLPQKFAIKTTHDSCHYALVHNKNEMNINDIRKTIEDGLKKNHYYMCREWPYKDLRPRIIAEELISDNPPDDYKFFMFHGKMDSVMVCTERATGHPKFRFYDQDWNRLYYQKTDREPATDVKMPANFLEMIKVAETLSTGFVHVKMPLL